MSPRKPVPDFEVRVADADAYAIEATAKLAELIAEVGKAADLLRPFASGHELDIDHLALNGTKAELELWRSTRIADAGWREVLARWRTHWQNLKARSGPFAHLPPRGFDLYLWERPEDCDHEAVRLGVEYVQQEGSVKLTPLHVDIVRVAQQDTPARLLGPNAALDVIGPDGIVQEAHPLRCGVRYAGVENAYFPDRPTWIPPQEEPPPPMHYDESLHDRAAFINRARASGAMAEDGTYSSSEGPRHPVQPSREH